ncbi:nonribosomal peptide synthetase MxaA [Ancylobacter oerskovii]|uniref:Nonribosomal peptide synthetase MxaA n=1 Tax=Ancylobacter oerskovii TaxID=459519 RepID=A0ABW4YUF2_9HYPH|nr:nonribosomal peptide synthetase MxaA [Ancylobacter oerskovii]MBS7544657.1 nonribosomal peptide synthetase MxaA [Ancylobacter oerskovii]
MGRSARRLVPCLARLLPMAALLLAAPPVGAQLRSVELYAPRPFGHVIGDTLALSAEIVLDAPFRLDPASLPRPRALDYWLELANVRLTNGGASDGVQRYTLDLTYQTFYAPLEPKRLTIPAVPLTATDGTRQVAIAVPPWSFLMSPLREIVATGESTPMALRPDIAPRPVATASTQRGLLAALGGLVAGLGLLAWQMGWGPFGRRRDRPFARAAREVRVALAASARSAASSTAPASAPGQRAALLALHRAFDATAGKGVFAEDLPDFFRAHPAFTAAEAEVRRLFAASRHLFFGENPLEIAREFPPAGLIALARRLRAIERGGA